jgi:hypothetical protein
MSMKSPPTSEYGPLIAQRKDREASWPGEGAGESGGPGYPHGAAEC